MSSQISFPAPDDCARAFYEAFANRDLDTLMSTWADDEEICCVPPGSVPLYGFSAIRAAMESILRNNAPMRLELQDEHWYVTIGMAIQHALEWIYVGDEQQPRASIFITNVYLRLPQGWRLLSHVTSPIQTGFALGSSNVVLH